MTMRRTDNGIGPAPPQTRRVPADQLLPDLALYERLIDQGTATADARGSPVDHVTARRLAIWLAARPQEPSFAQGLARFINTGTIQRELKNQLRVHARSGAYTDRAEAARLMQYCIARGADLGPVGDEFGSACHQMDRADLMLTDARDRTGTGTATAGQASPDTDGPQITALARYDPQSQTSPSSWMPPPRTSPSTPSPPTLEEREAHLREVQLLGQDLPEGSYGRRNRQAITDRETRVAARLRAVEQEYHAAIERDAVPMHPSPLEYSALPSWSAIERSSLSKVCRAAEHAYRMAHEHDAVPSPLETSRAFRSPEHAADREIELK